MTRVRRRNSQLIARSWRAVSCSRGIRVRSGKGGSGKGKAPASPVSAVRAARQETRPPLQEMNPSACPSDPVAARDHEVMDQACCVRSAVGLASK
jgi:hypothetical protein